MMDEYPEILLPRQSYPVLSGDDILECYFIRKTPDNIYLFLKQGYTEKEIIRKIFKPMTPSRDVFEFSVFLYGYYDDKNHVDIRVVDISLDKDWENTLPDIPTSSVKYEKETAFPLFLTVAELYNQSIDFNGKQYLLSFSHKPTCANYWHFQLWTQDTSTGKYIPRELTGLSSAEKKHIENLAKHILIKHITKAICPKSDAKPFQRDDFDKAINQAS
ncbi:hypothetical protein ACYULU_06210 [Breznakiellaceae bacterium SP9]